MTDERWQQILRLMDAAYKDYLAGMAAVRKRVVDDVKRKVGDRTVPDHPELLFAVNLHGFLRCTPFDGVLFQDRRREAGVA